MPLFEVRSARREEALDITAQVAQAVSASGAAEGAVLVFPLHTTAGIFINENADPDVGADILEHLARLAPREGRWRHAEGNSDAHLKAALVGSSVLAPVEGGRLRLGTWQGIFLAEFDGPRKRQVQVQILAASH